MNYARIYQEMMRWYGKLPYLLGKGYAFPPLHLFLEITYRCNLSCEMCQFFQFLGTDEARHSLKDELTTDEIKKTLGALPWYTLVTFTGGELFLRKDMMDILGWAASRRRISLISNGTLVDAKRAAMLADMAPRSLYGKGLLLVDVSLEGAEDVHDKIAGVKGAFAKTVNALSVLSAARKKSGNKYPLLNMKTVITGRNVGQLEYLFDLACEMGLDIFNPIIYARQEAHSRRLSDQKGADIQAPSEPGGEVDIRKLKEQLDLIETKSKEPGRPIIRYTPSEIPTSEILRYYSGELMLRDYACFSPWTVAALSAYGEVSVCSYSSQGNIRKNGFMQIWNGEKMRDLRRNIRRDKIYPGCMGCCNMSYLGRRR